MSNGTQVYFPRELPEALAPLTELALDLRWTWSHSGDRLWELLDADAWEVTENPWVILQNVPEERLHQLVGDAEFRRELDALVSQREAYLRAPGRFDQGATPGIAYFSMEFGLGAALPLYAGGLGVLAGDYLKAASDLGLPMVGVGLLYQEGYFRQVIDQAGRQRAVYPYNEPSTMPIQPVSASAGGWLRIPLEFPGRRVMLRVWRANVGRVSLYLLDSNDPFNAPIDRGINAKLYGRGRETRLMQEIVLGIGGWRMLEALGLDPPVCHLNEGHAALAVLERARTCMEKMNVGFWEAMRATRAGNLFTTHTPVAAGFDAFDARLIDRYRPYFEIYVRNLGVSLDEILALGRADPSDPSQPFTMAYLAMRGCSAANAVSRLHGEVSRRVFAELYPRWPEDEVPVGHVTNGVHVPSWDSPWADRLWTQACGTDRWRGTTESLAEAIGELDDEALWSLCARERQDLVGYVRLRLRRQLGQRGHPPDELAVASQTLDPNVLIVGFARRFTEYKRPNLLLHDPDRLRALLTHSDRPMQIIVAGKAHPADLQGQKLIEEWIRFANSPAVRNRVVFLEDYDIDLAQELVQGVDVWINTPRRPWEACGTSGMKVLVNGGLNLSSLDGWWAEAWSPDIGWVLGDGHDGDEAEAGSLYRILEEEVIPTFYGRDELGIPREWVKRMRASMARLTPRFSSNRMAEDYVRDYYVPAGAAFADRKCQEGALARELEAWACRTRQGWGRLHFGELQTSEEGGSRTFRVQVYLCDLQPEDVRVELYSAPAGARPERVSGMEVVGEIPGSIRGYIYQGSARADRPEGDYTPRVVPFHPKARVPIENPLILWQR